jgi:hypothetical protein
MPKRRGKRQQHIPTNPSPPARSGGPPVNFPSAPTLFRTQLIDRRTHALLRRIPAAMRPILQERDRAQIELVKQAATPAALIDLAPAATGLAESTWQDRMRQLGPDAIPLIGERLAHASQIRDANQRTLLYEKLIGELRWRGDSGAEALLASFGALDDYSRSLASVVLGLLGARSSAGRIWDFYQKVTRNPRESYFVGALWGLIDLQDERASGALVDLLHRRQTFYELPGFLALAGDARAIIPLMHTIIHAPEDDRYDLAMALTAIGHRIGREALVAELDKTVAAERPREVSQTRADQILERPASAVEEHFVLFYRGLTPEDLARAMET